MLEIRLRRPLDFTNAADVGMLKSDQINGSSLAQCGKLWTGASVSGQDGGHKCHTSLMEDRALGGGKAPSMCLREYADAVSDAVRSAGSWPDCPSLSELWTTLPNNAARVGSPSCNICPGSSRPPSSSKLFVEVGANIGACTAQMLARPDVDMVVAWEPNPANLFYLTTTVLNNGYNSKIALFTSGLGDAPGTHAIYAEAGNAGNTVVDSPIHASRKPVGQIEIMTLDEAFMAGGEPPYIHLMKIDAQGFETKILRGGQKLLKSGAVNAVKFELAEDWLVGHGSSGAELFSVFGSNSFDIHAGGDQPALTREELRQIACPGQGLIRDFLAIYNPTKDTASSQIAC